MAIKDNKSPTDVLVLFNDVITSDGTVITGSVDTAEYDNGITFNPILINDGNGTEITITSVEDSPDDINFTTVSNDQLIGNISNLIFNTPVVSEDIIKTLGIIGSSRFVRLILNVTGFTDQVNFTVTVNAGLEVLPNSIIGTISSENFYIDSDNDFYVDSDENNYTFV